MCAFRMEYAYQRAEDERAIALIEARRGGATVSFEDVLQETLDRDDVQNTARRTAARYGRAARGRVQPS